MIAHVSQSSGTLCGPGRARNGLRSAGGLAPRGGETFHPKGPLFWSPTTPATWDVLLLGNLGAPAAQLCGTVDTLLPPVGLANSLGGSLPDPVRGTGAPGMKETLRRLRAGGIVVLFPEGTRMPTASSDR